MKTSDTLTTDKLRGGFYSPSKLVDLAISRAISLKSHISNLKVLEPSCGDGAFITGFSRSTISNEVDFTGIEILKEEALKSSAKLIRFQIQGNIINKSYFDAHTDIGGYDIVVGNPPYVRYQFTSEADKKSIDKISLENNIDIKRVANIWVPIVISSISKLKNGGTFAFIIPDESLAGVAAKQFRKWLLSNCSELTIDVFPPKIFEGVLQETLIISGRRASGNNVVRFIQHYPDRNQEEWLHTIVNNDTWYRYLLNSKQLSVYEDIQSRTDLVNKFVKFDVSIVTGANDYFCIDHSTMQAFELEPWAEPLLARSRQSRGAVYTRLDHRKSISMDEKSYILNFSPEKPDPLDYEKPSEYIKIGEEVNLDKRYKCTVRKPWYRIPNMVGGKILLSKRSHYSPRVIYNQHDALTTDTIYRGRLIKNPSINETDFICAFHNSLTLLSAEIEGRSFGGGVLEMVPSEVSRMRIIIPTGIGSNIDTLDDIFREGKDDTSFGEAVEFTNKILLKGSQIIPQRDMDVLNDSLNKMRDRRLSRN
ncbi:Eco57I restriction-modification methylase domain-containing protein [Deinococcus aquiradiocola]|uniref:Eco57I restriction-modification methylase domain-containing protein n=1 Tax=Deinococcus aquiradiocola TaxID=393059 RepID=UPI001667E98E|nr:N-6 DNA methylase [Deinococcus aquiradiocola]